MKLLVAGLAEMRAQLATVIANQAHLATREWVGERLFRAGVLIVTILLAALAFAPHLWTFLGSPGFAR